MDVLVVYDVATEDKAGRKRLRRVARACLDYGQRVQKSVFECSLDARRLKELVSRLRAELDLKQDSLRIYQLHGGRDRVLQVLGRDFGPARRPATAPVLV